MTTTYLSRDMSRDGVPFPNPSSAPDAVTDTADTTNPAHMMRSAVPPAFIVDTFSVNIPISLSGISRHTTVPASMIPTFNASVMVNIFFTLACSPAP